VNREALERAFATDAATLQYSDGLLAEAFQVGAGIVGRVRRGLEARGVIPTVRLRRCVDGRERDVSRIGRRLQPLSSIQAI